MQVATRLLELKQTGRGSEAFARGTGNGDLQQLGDGIGIGQCVVTLDALDRKVGQPGVPAYRR